MPEITIELIRRKAEHNEGLIHTLEELTLHQEELESINETLGCNCRRLKILYLQNNIIGEMKNLHHMKDLEYLNLALNNITKVKGLHSCEFLNKLDLTVNFVDLDDLECSVTAMEGNLHLKDLYMMGNPCQSWEGFEDYVIARLPQLERLDGKEITRTSRIRAQQRLPSLRKEITPLAEQVRQRKRQEILEQDEKARQTSKLAARSSKADAVAVDGIGASGNVISGDGEGDYDVTASPIAPGKHDEIEREEGKEELTKHTPEVRMAIYREMAEQKKEKEDRQKENLPKERNFENEQEEAIARARERESEGVILQCNEGKLAFRFEETRPNTSGVGGSSREGGGGESGGGAEIVLEVSVPRYLDSSLIDVDIHPHYVSIVIKGKVLRLSLQTEVEASKAKARRSKTTGSLVITMPKVDPRQSIGLRSTAGRRAPGIVADRDAVSKNATANDIGRTKSRGRGTPTLAQLMMEEAKAATAAAAGEKSGEAGPAPSQRAVSIRGIIGPRHGGLAVKDLAAAQLSEVASTRRTAGDFVDTNRGALSFPKLEPNSAMPAPKNTVSKEGGIVEVRQSPDPSAGNSAGGSRGQEVVRVANWCSLDEVD